MVDRPSGMQRVLAAVECNRRRLWALCYRMTGDRAESDDLTQEAIARAIERADQQAGEDATGWLLRLTARLCLDHLRGRRDRRRRVELVDPIEVDWVPSAAADPAAALVLREDVRFAVVAALQRLSPRQRAVLILHEVCEQPLAEIAVTLGTNPNAAKALLHRARAALAAERRRSDVDVPVDPEVVDRFARAIAAGALDELAELLSEDVWGVVDGGGVVGAASKPTQGRRAVSRQWSNAAQRLGQPVVADVRALNGEPAIVIRLASQRETILAAVHLETRAGQVVALRVNRDPRRLAYLARAVVPSAASAADASTHRRHVLHPRPRAPRR